MSRLGCLGSYSGFRRSIRGFTSRYETKKPIILQTLKHRSEEVAQIVCDISPSSRWQIIPVEKQDVGAHKRSGDDPCRNEDEII